MRMAQATWDTGWFQAQVFSLLLEDLGYTITDAETVVLDRGYWNITLWDTPAAAHSIAIRIRVNGTLRTMAFRQNGVSDFQSLGTAVFSDGTGGVEISGVGTGTYNCYYQRL